MIPLSRGGLDHPDNAIWVCSHCNSSKGNKRLYEFYELKNRNKIPSIAEGKYLKFLYNELDKRGLLESSRDNISNICDRCDLGKKCPVPEDLTVYCLESSQNELKEMIFLLCYLSAIITKIHI